MVINAYKIRKILLFNESGMSQRGIARKLSIGRGSVERLLSKAEVMRMTSVEARLMKDEELMNMFFPSLKVIRRTKELPDFKAVHDRITHTSHRSVMHEWSDYKKIHPDGYEYSRFTQLYKEWCGEMKVHPKLLMNEVPGQCMYVDWAGDTITCHFQGDAEPTKIYFFVTSLGASELPYVEPFSSMELENYVAGTVNALKYYGGIPKYVVPDNTKTAVTQNKDKEFQLQRVFEEMENYYGYTVLPARPLSPTDKNDVEANVHLSEDNIISDMKLKEDKYTSVEEVKNDCAVLLSEMILKKFKHTGYNRLQWFQDVDFPHLQPLKKDFILYSHEYVTVPASYHVHIKHDPHQYSVPYQYIGHEVILKYSFTDLIIEDKESGNEIARWPRFYSTSLDTVHTMPEHRPPSHQIAAALRVKDAQWYREQAGRIGPWTLKAVNTMLDHYKNHPEAIYRACMAVVSSVWDKSKNRYTYAELEKACMTAVKMDSVHWKTIKHCLQEVRTSGSSTGNHPRQHLPEHSNIRDKSIYK